MRTTRRRSRSRPGERYGFVYEINYLRCIHCDLCVEACPTEAITETKMFEFSFTNRADAIYTKRELVVGDDGQPQHLPWEDWRPGDDAHTSAWMRATSPVGSADYEGKVQWAGELGYGVRAPEGGQSDNRDDAATGNTQVREMHGAPLGRLGETAGPARSPGDDQPDPQEGRDPERQPAETAASEARSDARAARQRRVRTR